MASEILQYRADQIKCACSILRATIDRRFPPDEAIDRKLEELELEVTMFIRQLNKEKV